MASPKVTFISNSGAVIAYFVLFFFCVCVCFWTSTSSQSINKRKADEACTPPWRVYTTAKIGPDPSKNRAGPNNICKEIFNFLRGKRRVYTTVRIGPDSLKNWSGPDIFCKETVNFLRGHRRPWPREKLTVSLKNYRVRTKFWCSAETRL